MARSTRRFGHRAQRPDTHNRAEPVFSFTDRSAESAALAASRAAPQTPRPPSSQPQTPEAQTPPSQSSRPQAPHPQAPPKAKKLETMVGASGRDLHLYIPPDGRRGRRMLEMLATVIVAAIGIAGGVAWYTTEQPPVPDHVADSAPPDLSAFGPASDSNPAIAPDARATPAPSSATTTPADAPAATPAPRTAATAAPTPSPAPTPAPATATASTAPPAPAPAAAPKPAPAPATIASTPPAVRATPPSPPPPAAPQTATATMTKPAPAKALAATPAPRRPQPHAADVATLAPPSPKQTVHRKAPQEEDDVLANLPPSRDPQVTQQQPAAPVMPAQNDATIPHPPPAAAPDTVAVDGLNYVAGEQPQSLGTLGEAPPAASDAPTPLMPQQAAQSAPPSGYAPAPQSGYAPPPNPGLRPYQPSWAGAPLPNDLVILPNGQMMVPANQ